MTQGTIDRIFSRKIAHIDEVDQMKNTLLSMQKGQADSRLNIKKRHGLGLMAALRGYNPMMMNADNSVQY
jgi:hypothetical protein